MRGEDEQKGVRELPVLLLLLLLLLERTQFVS
jgi:hypothetical protein